MNNEILDLKQQVYQLTADFSDVYTNAAVALNTPPLTEETLELVRRSQSVGEVYEGALNRLLSTLHLHSEGDAGEMARVEKLKELLHHELGLLLSHPALET